MKTVKVTTDNIVSVIDVDFDEPEILFSHRLRARISLPQMMWRV